MASITLSITVITKPMAGQLARIRIRSALPGGIFGAAENAKSGGWIKGAIKHPGRMKRAAEHAGMSTHAYMEKHKHDSGSTGSAARLGLTLSKMHKK